MSKLGVVCMESKLDRVYTTIVHVSGTSDIRRRISNELRNGSDVYTLASEPLRILTSIIDLIDDQLFADIK